MSQIRAAHALLTGVVKLVAEAGTQLEPPQRPAVAFLIRTHRICEEGVSLEMVHTLPVERGGRTPDVEHWRAVCPPGIGAHGRAQTAARKSVVDDIFCERLQVPPKEGRLVRVHKEAPMSSKIRLMGGVEHGLQRH
eukprot:7380913-Prymnesium_polylepis.1